MTRLPPACPQAIPRVGSLFSGGGMLDHAVHQVLGGRAAWFVENDPAASKVLAHHWPEVPNHGDVTAVDWASVEPVDVLVGGPPCQDVSSAGCRLGLRPGTRSGLWSHMAYAISVLRPELVVIENVRGLLSADAACELEPCPWCLGDHEGRPLRALGAILGDLADLGFDARWCGLRASDIGAPHGRFRVFAAAWPAASNTTGPGGGWNEPEHVGDHCGVAVRAGQAKSGRRDSATPDTKGPPVVADSPGDGRGEGWTEPAGVLWGPDVAVGRDEAPANSDGDGRERNPERNVGPFGSEQPAPHGQDPAGRVLDWGDYAPAVERWGRILGRAAPPPTQVGARGGQQLSPAFTEWLMGWPRGWVTDVPGLSRNEQLKICGNGVVPQQCAAALSWLLNAEVLAA